MKLKVFACNAANKRFLLDNDRVHPTKREGLINKQHTKTNESEKN